MTPFNSTFLQRCVILNYLDIAALLRAGYCYFFPPQYNYHEVDNFHYLNIYNCPHYYHFNIIVVFIIFVLIVKNWT